MRRPTEDAYQWWNDALAGKSPQVTHEPQPGFFLKKEAQGVFTPCSIWLEQPIDEETGELLGDEVLLCEIGGVPADPEAMWTWVAKRPCSREEYDRRMAELITGIPVDLPF